MASEIGVCRNLSGEYASNLASHLDCIAWVKRDSYLPQGSHGLKAVCRAKLGYDPLEIDPEDMTRFALEKPQLMASYSVSDAVATYYLYRQYVHGFIFSLCTIIPNPPDEVLRKGSGTLCEALLMVEAFRGGIVCPNKHEDDPNATHNGKLLESETYIGGHVECLQTGVYRNDLPVKFKVVPEAVQGLIDGLDEALRFAVETEGGKSLADVENLGEVKAALADALGALRDQPNRLEVPLIYHLDVGAMYPNIILTNRLQPSSMVSETDCAACVFNADPDAACKRPMPWSWRAEAFPASRAETESVRAQIQYETVQFDAEAAAAAAKARFGGGGAGGRFGGKGGGGAAGSQGGGGGGGGAPSGLAPVAFLELPADEQDRRYRERLKSYCHKVFGRTHETIHEVRTATVCQRENPFYVDTVLAFRDRRYTYKGLAKEWGKKRGDAAERGDATEEAEASSMHTLYDSLQLAHKCILNSFYG